MTMFKSIVWAVTSRDGGQHLAVAGTRNGEGSPFVYSTACNKKIQSDSNSCYVDLIDCPDCKAAACAQLLRNAK